VRIRTCLFALSLLLPTLANAGGNVRWNLGATSGFTFAAGSTRTVRGPGLRHAGGRYVRPRAPAGTLIPVAQVGRVGGPTINFRNPQMYVSPGSAGFFRQQLGPTITASVQQQCRQVPGGRRQRHRRQLQGVRTHGVGATAAGYRFPHGR
jgi:hypothetical protein